MLKVGLCTAILTSGIVHTEIIDIDTTELHALIDKGTVVIDIRRPDEWQSLGVLKDSDPITFFDPMGGYRTVYNVRKGIDHWIKEGNHTVALP